MANYPSTLPCPRLQGSIKIPKSFDITEFEHGNRSRKSYFCETYLDFQFVYDYDEMLTFMDFYDNTLDKGVLPFSANWEVLPGLTFGEYRFADSPEIAYNDKYYTVSVKLIAKN